MTTAAELFAQAQVILLDFDGPVTRLLPPPANAELAASARSLAAELGMPLTPELETTTDHLAIIRAANRYSPDVAMHVEAHCTTGEREAATSSTPTPGVRDVLEACARRGATVIVVTNNSPECAVDFLRANDLSSLVQEVIGRDPEHIDEMKPSPAMLVAAMKEHHGNALMIGDSVSDMTAATAAQVPAIGLAKNDHRAEELDGAGARTVVRSMHEFTP